MSILNSTLEVHETDICNINIDKLHSILEHVKEMTYESVHKSIYNIVTNCFRPASMSQISDGQVGIYISFHPQYSGLRISPKNAICIHWVFEDRYYRLVMFELRDKVQTLFQGDFNENKFRGAPTYFITKDITRFKL